jgi:hypothetical protein
VVEDSVVPLLPDLPCHEECQVVGGLERDVRCCSVLAHHSKGVALCIHSASLRLGCPVQDATGVHVAAARNKK